eukprot:jgi/Botrbrau1/15108/Bobra.0303s0001.1
MFDDRPVKLVIFDLDGTLLDSETAVLEVSKEVLEKHGSQLTQEVREAASGRRPLEAWQAAIDILGLHNVTAQELFDESEVFLKEKCEPIYLVHIEFLSLFICQENRDEEEESGM